MLSYFHIEAAVPRRLQRLEAALEAAVLMAAASYTPYNHTSLEQPLTVFLC